MKKVGISLDDRRAFVRHVLTLEPAAKRGEYRYSNAGFAVAATMIEQATGTQWEQLVQRRILQPLAMKTAGFGWPAKSDPSQPWGHETKDGALVLSDPNGSYQLPAGFAPAGDLHMSMPDLAAFERAQLRALRGQKSILSAASAQTLHTLRVRGGLGLGVQTIDDIQPVSTHSGSADTFWTAIAIAPNHDVAVAVSANAANEAASLAVKTALVALLKRYAVAQLP